MGIQDAFPFWGSRFRRPLETYCPGSENKGGARQAENFAA